MAPKVNQLAKKCLDLEWVQRILYNSYFQTFQPNRGFRQRIAERAQKPYQDAAHRINSTFTSPPLAWKYQTDYPTDQKNITKESSSAETETEEEESEWGPVHFPYQFSRTEFLRGSDNDTEKSSAVEEAPEGPKYVSEYEKLIKTGKNLDEILTGDNKSEGGVENLIDDREFGTADARIPSSNVPCGGCGAHLHCQDSSIPGFMPSERFKVLLPKTLRGEICLRCYCLKNFNTALNVNVSREDYPVILKQMGYQKSMILLLVDLTDFPCSIWPGIIDIIGHKQPVFLVGNKVDLLPQDSNKYLHHVLNCLRKTAQEVGLDQARIIHTALISAATGYGIEDLITDIYRKWGSTGDIHIMGCTNVGKSSLFNALLQSDLCKAQVADLVQRATISQWPGTTLNLLKFPVMRADAWRLAARLDRLNKEAPDRLNEKFERNLMLRATKSLEHATLIGHVGRSFLSSEKEDARKRIPTQDPFKYSRHLPKEIGRIGEWDPEDRNVKGRWCFDTPGTVNENQILDILTLPELMKVLPKSLIEPSTYYIKIGMTMFVGGIARIDFIAGFKPIRFTVFASKQIPITILFTEDADDFYKKAFGSPVLGIPEGSLDRLAQFPPLKPTDYTFTGEGHNKSCGDIVLSSIGWVGVTAGIRHKCDLRVHTPDGRGVYFREPALLPNSVNLKGLRIRDTPAYLPHKLFVPRNAHE